MVAIVIALVVDASHGNEAWAWVIAGVCLPTAVLFWVFADRLGSWVLLAGALIGAVMVSIGVYASSTPVEGLVGRGSPEMFYVLLILYTAYYLPARETALIVTLSCLLYGAILIAVPDPGSTAIIGWLILVPSLSGIAILVHKMKAHNERLMAKLSDEGRVDPLTALYNRRAFDETWALELERARRSEDPVCLIVADLDHFKRYNDELGHPAGDRALCRVATILREHRRAIDTVARLGGEEFAIVAPDCDRRVGERIAEQARVAVERAFRTEAVPLTMSFGVVAYPDTGKLDERLIHAADEALYEAKREGRNRVASGPDVEPAAAEAALDPH